MLQSSFTSRIGGSARVREAVVAALAEGRGVTAKIRWITTAARHRGGGYYDDAATAGRSRWIHCTPLLGGNGAVGVWMVVLVDDEAEAEAAAAAARRAREAAAAVLDPASGGDVRHGHNHDPKHPRRRANREVRGKHHGRNHYAEPELNGGGAGDAGVDADADADGDNDDDQMSLSSFAAAQRIVHDERGWPRPPTREGPLRSPPLDLRSVGSVDLGPPAPPPPQPPPPPPPLPLPRPGNRSLQSGLRNLFSKHGRDHGGSGGGGIGGGNHRRTGIIVEPGMGDNAWLGSLR